MTPPTHALPEPDLTNPDRWTCNAAIVELEPATGPEGEATIWLRDQPLNPDDAYELAISLLAAWQATRDTPVQAPAGPVGVLKPPGGHSETKPGVTDGYTPDTAGRIRIDHITPDGTINATALGGINVEDIDTTAIATQLRAANEAGEPITRLDGSPWLP